MHDTAHAAPSAARCVSDLAWLLQSPPLLSLVPEQFSAQVQAFDDEQTAHISRWLAQLDAQHLQSYVAQALPAKAPMRLGRYAERLMEYFLRHAGLFDLFAANLPLRSPSGAGGEKTHTTVGEFDYLIRDAQGQNWHWELAVKFYLFHPAAVVAQAHDFKGPAGKDTLGLKLGKVFDKQLRHVPPAPYDSTLWQAAAYARGWLFYPQGEAATATQQPCEALNPNHLRGGWLTETALSNAQFAGAHFVHLPRLHWLAPYGLNELPIMDQTQMAQYLSAFWQSSDRKQADAGQMIACVAPCGDGWHELSRSFVLPSKALSPVH